MNADTTALLWEDYKKSRNELKSALAKSKREKWEQLIDEVRNDMWGKPYKLVMNKFCKKGSKLPEPLNRLFPTHINFGRTSRR